MQPQHASRDRPQLGLETLLDYEPQRGSCSQENDDRNLRVVSLGAFVRQQKPLVSRSGATSNSRQRPTQHPVDLNHAQTITWKTKGDDWKSSANTTTLSTSTSLFFGYSGTPSYCF